VTLYVAPQDPATPITTRIEDVGPACRSGALGDGGSKVVVGIWSGGTKLGAVAFAHLNVTVHTGDVVDRWGTQLGTVGSYTPNVCWSGVHLHTEMVSQHNYSCFNKGWHPGQPTEPTNFVGFVGGSYATGPRSACP
jgi:hypothetical protein